jgi:hypothetical protein
LSQIRWISMLVLSRVCCLMRRFFPWVFMCC